MSLTNDTASRAEPGPSSTGDAPEEVHLPTSPHEPVGFLLKAYVLMYCAGLAWIAALLAVAVTFVKLLIILFLRFSWTTASAIGSNPEQPDLQIAGTGLALVAAIGLSFLAVVLSRAVRQLINNGPSLPARQGLR
ncbi:hypothetical protein [Leucobacter aridicollis]|uniref:hypothetical protein n=1 Tax=Leucobacter aridicollis TaxID=283878 RepID=UPI00210591B2|nr:hypothetical protein [Leucobacter aridicollis]UTX53314.1 hypothetical protein KI794_00650 [Leucobacter aridicollis]